MSPFLAEGGRKVSISFLKKKNKLNFPFVEKKVRHFWRMTSSAPFPQQLYRRDLCETRAKKKTILERKGEMDRIRSRCWPSPHHLTGTPRHLFRPYLWIHLLLLLLLGWAVIQVDTLTCGDLLTPTDVVVFLFPATLLFKLPVTLLDSLALQRIRLGLTGILPPLVAALLVVDVVTGGTHLAAAAGDGLVSRDLLNPGRATR